MPIAIILILVAAVAIFFLVTYNSLTKDKNRIELAEVELRKYEEAGDPKDIDNAKKYYNAVLRDYNNKVESFPTSLVANMFNFPKMHTEEFDEGL
ncbi:MAG: LemA family protein [Clostridiales bacterium]|nr:LemA family protein [Clostridiales bacterium]MBR0468671.1 LemA family protein [Mogibacterium sp.]